MLDQTCRFFEALYAGKPDDAAVCVWRLSDKRSEWFLDPALAAGYASKHFEQDLYAQIAVGPMKHGNQRLKAAEVTGLPALWVDFDIEGSAHQKKMLPRTVTEALAILPAELPPSMIVGSGYGAHAYWLLKEMFLIESEEDRARAALALEQWERLIRLRAHTHGWTVDATHDLARILRIPGTRNNKLRDKGYVVDCVLIDLNERRYNLSEFEEYLAAIPGVTHDPESIARQIARPLPDLGSLILTPDRKFQKLDWMMKSERFAAIWNHERSDFTDTSQSAYDLGLANILYDAGLTDQEICDAMIQNRADRGLQSKLTRDYHRRTLSKARSRRKGGQNGEGPLNGAPPIKCKTPEEKSAMCEKLSKMLNLNDANGQPGLLRVIKIPGDDPIWRFELMAGISITANAKEVLSRAEMNRLIFAATDRQIEPYSRAEWSNVVAAISEATVIQLAGLENYATGELHQLLEQYLQANGVKFTPEEALGDVRFLFMPFEAGGHIAVSAAHFREWVMKQKGEKLEASDLANRFSAIGAEIRNFDTEAGRQKQSRWALPACFDPATWRRLAVKARAVSADDAPAAGMVQ